MNNRFYKNHGDEESLKEEYASIEGYGMDEYDVSIESYDEDAPENVIAETEMIWTMVNV